jgi:tRNA (cytosine49-C5)-methyltransferase
MDARQAEKDAIKAQVKPAYREHYVELLGSEEAYERFIDAALEFPKRVVRINTLKIGVEQCLARLRAKGWTLIAVPWCAYAFTIERFDRRDIGNLEEHALGYIYVQEASSLIPPMVLDPQPGEIVLDLAAAPGSKTTQLAQLMENKGVIIANELDYSRLASLKANLERCGVQNAVVTNLDGRHVKLSGFDRILVDAPCSGTGTLSKSLKPLEMWNPRSLPRLCRIQSGLLDHAYSLLRPGGSLVYSTCSLEIDENEAVLDRFYRAHPEAIADAVSIPKASEPYRSWRDVTYDERVANAARLWPHHSGSDGFFVARMRKPV